MPHVRVEVRVVQPFFSQTFVNNGLDLLKWVRDNVDPLGKYVLCQDNQTPIADCDHLDNILLQLGDSSGFQVRKLGEFTEEGISGHVRTAELWPDPERLKSVDYAREILGDLFNARLDDENENDNGNDGDDFTTNKDQPPPEDLIHSGPADCPAATSSGFSASMSTWRPPTTGKFSGNPSIWRLKGVPGFGYPALPRAVKQEIDPLRRDDVTFWESLGTGNEPWEVVEVRGRQMMVAFLAGEKDEAVRLFLQGRVDITVRDSINSTLLHWAIQADLHPIVAKLIEYHCNVDHRNDLNETPLALACRHQRWGLVEQLLDKEGKDPGTLPCDFDSQDLTLGQTALHWCTRWKNFEAVTNLLNRGADVNLADESGITPLHLACKNGDLGMVKLLLQAGANVNAGAFAQVGARAGAGWKTPVRIAQETANRELVDLLIEYGGDPSGDSKTDLERKQL